MKQGIYISRSYYTKTRLMARFEKMVNHVAQGISRAGGMCVKYQAMRTRWQSSACARETARKRYRNGY